MANILHRFIKTEKIKDKKASDLVVNKLELKDIEVREETEMLLKVLIALKLQKNVKNVKLLYCNNTALAEKA